MRLTFVDAGLDDVPAITALRNSVAGALTARFGEGRWSLAMSERSTASTLRHARVRVGCSGKRVLTVLRLARKKPWAIDPAYFTPVRVPLYLTDIAVSVPHQGQGLGWEALTDAVAVAREMGAEVIRLDAYDGEVGAGAFYAGFGYEECGRVVYKGNPLVYYEFLLD